jgi:hypothetical protein
MIIINNDDTDKAARMSAHTLLMTPRFPSVKSDHHYLLMVNAQVDTKWKIISLL